MTEIDDTPAPPGVELTSWDDYPKKRQQIFDASKSAIQQSFPQSYGGVRLELHDVDYENPKEFTLAEQKDALMKNQFLHHRLRGTFKLFDEKTGAQLDEQRQTLMRVPYLTERGTFEHAGSEYVTNSQARLMPGIYHRKQANGTIEAHFNAKRGSGQSFRINLEPESGLFKMDIGQSSLRLYSLLKDIGIPDEQIEKSWGPELLKKNQDKYDARVFEKAYARLVRRPDPKATREQKIEAIKQALGNTKVSREVLKRTLPNLVNQNEMDDVKSAREKQGYLMVNFEPKDKERFTKWTKFHVPQSQLGESGVETHPHITLRYGLNTNDTDSLVDFFKDKKPVSLTLGRTKRFSADWHGGQDALVVDVKSPELHELHRAVTKQFHAHLAPSSYPAYQPHVTLAYLQPGAAPHLDDNPHFSGTTYQLKSVTYSNPRTNTRIHLPLKG